MLRDATATSPRRDLVGSLRDAFCRWPAGGPACDPATITLLLPPDTVPAPALECRLPDGGGAGQDRVTPNKNSRKGSMGHNTVRLGPGTVSGGPAQPRPLHGLSIP